MGKSFSPKRGLASNIGQLGEKLLPKCFKSVVHANRLIVDERLGLPFHLR